MITGYSNTDQYLGRYGDREFFRVNLAGWDARHPHVLVFSVPHEWYMDHIGLSVDSVYLEAVIDEVVTYEQED